MPDGFEGSQAIVELTVDFATIGTIDQVNADYGTTVISAIASENIYLLQLPEAMDEEVFEAMLDEDERIEWADLNFESAVPSGSTGSFFFNVEPSAYSSQYVWNQVNFGGAAPPPAGPGAGPVVALLDTGLDAAHPALAGMTVLSGWNFIDNPPSSNVSDIANGIDDDLDGNIDELVGHGTFTAGLIAHIAPRAAILPIRVLNSDGASNSFHVAQGIYYAIEHGATIINLSLGTTNNSELVADAVQEARDSGILVLAAAGNANQLAPLVYPAADPNVLGVAGTDQGDYKAGFSNYGPHITLCAPSVNVVSLYPGGLYARCSGTSAAAAIISGAVALLKSHNPQAGADDLRAWVTGSADSIDQVNPAFSGLLGAGRLNIGAALDIAPSAVFGDLNGDEFVNVSDLLILINAWGQTSPADLNANGIVDVDDLLLLLANWS